MIGRPALEVLKGELVGVVLYYFCKVFVHNAEDFFVLAKDEIHEAPAEVADVFLRQHQLESFVQTLGYYKADCVVVTLREFKVERGKPDVQFGLHFLVEEVHARQVEDCEFADVLLLVLANELVKLYYLLLELQVQVEFAQLEHHLPK